MAHLPVVICFQDVGGVWARVDRPFEVQSDLWQRMHRVTPLVSALYHRTYMGTVGGMAARTFSDRFQYASSVGRMRMSCVLLASAAISAGTLPAWRQNGRFKGTVRGASATPGAHVSNAHAKNNRQGVQKFLRTPRPGPIRTSWWSDSPSSEASSRSPEWLASTQHSAGRAPKVPRRSGPHRHRSPSSLVARLSLPALPASSGAAVGPLRPPCAEKLHGAQWSAPVPARTSRG